ncbi:extensin-like [Vigna angularis]|uniref:extensin-like n=1 Tax=Phaseolus angularis TaxID=3914 RepID=UPI0022B3A3E9|nr:extensin-like [Vigna angularis]
MGEAFSERKRVARPKKRQRQAPKYVLRVLARLPTIAAPDTSSVGPSSTPTIQPLTPTVDPTPTSAINRYNTPIVHPSPTPAAHPSTTPIADPLPPLMIITPTPPLVVLTPTPLPDRTSIPSSSCIPPSKTVTPFADPDSRGDVEGLDPPLHDRPWIEPYGKE